MRASAVATVVLALLSLPGAASAAPSAQVCIPGAQVECPCVGGTKSVQVCAADGASLLPCQCAAAPVPARAAAAPPLAGGMTPAAFTVAPAGTAAAGLMGSLDVSAAAPASISVDGGEVGRAPIHVRDLQPGVHIVGARFDSGGESRKKVRVGAGAATVIVVDPPMSAQAGAWRRGLHVGPAVSTEWLGIQEDFGGGGPAVSPELLANLGISSVLDVRLGGRLMLANAKHGFIAIAGVPLSARLNLGSLFSSGVGAFTGVSFAYRKQWISVGGGYTGYTYPRETSLVAGLEAFPAIFRLGARREIELALGAGYLYHLTHDTDVIHFGVNVTYLFL